MPLDLSDFTTESRKVGKLRRCLVGQVLEQLDPKDRKVVEGALAADPLDVSAGAVVNVLAREGHAINVSSVTSHRVRSCTCFK
jgi:hypothetical protein